uniref:Uncharacterized protein n=1 Tax=Panagrellus redivivus TaxID=6233 RepID=A0A7E4VQU5_PANRE
MLLAAVKFVAGKAFRSFIFPRMLTAYRKRDAMAATATAAATGHRSTTQNDTTQRGFKDGPAHGSKTRQAVFDQAYANFSTSFQNLKHNSSSFKPPKIKWSKVRKFGENAVKGAVVYGFQRELYERCLKPGFEAVYPKPADPPKSSEAPKADDPSQCMFNIDSDSFDAKSTTSADFMAAKFEMVKETYPDATNMLHEKLFQPKPINNVDASSESTVPPDGAPNTDPDHVFGDFSQFNDASFDLNIDLIALVADVLEKHYSDPDGLPEAFKEWGPEKYEALKELINRYREHPEELAKKLEELFE